MRANWAASRKSSISRTARTVPLDGILPGSDFIGVPNTDPVYRLTKALWTIAPVVNDARIKVYGWVNPGISVSTSNKSSIPESYAIAPIGSKSIRAF